MELHSGIMPGSIVGSNLSIFSRNLNNPEVYPKLQVTLYLWELLLSFTEAASLFYIPL